MSDLIDKLKAFNSKERFFLIGKILGNPNFKPSAAFLKSLGAKLDLNIPSDVFSAMDYHIDWIYAALKLSENGNEKIFSNAEKLVKGQQQDIDYLIAYDADNQTHIILIEAKGVTGWTNKQMTSKTERFKDIFGKEGKHWSKVAPHFVLISPREPKGLKYFEWPEWMVPQGEVKWLKLPVCRKKLKKVTGCNIEGKPSVKREYWMVTPR